MKIGFIGIGNLGTPIALNIIESGHSLYVYNRTVSKTAPLSAKGAIVCEDVSSLAKQCTVVFTLVSDDTALKSIVESENGLLKHLQPGSIHVSMSTILPQTAVDLAALHIREHQHYLAAPVFGRPEAAVAKKLNVVLSGEEKIQIKMKPLLLDAGAIGVWNFGEDVQTANIVKLCGNFLIVAAIEAIGESISLAEKSGVDAKQMWNMLLQTLFNTPVYQNYSNIILQKKFEPASFTAKLGLKDLNLVLQQAAMVDLPMPLAEMVKQNMEHLVSAGKGHIDWSAVSNAAEKK
jgi:3-hydroxyisobutyrate dehydrogenase-like beta-hydroxyacid dehydrogenase